MTNRYFTNTIDLIDGTKARASDVEANFSAVDAGFTTVQTEMDAKAPLASPALTGTPTAPTAAPGTSSTQLATTEFVTAQSFASSLPAMGGNSGKYIYTDGFSASWQGIIFGAGLITAPSITVGDASTGFYRPALNQVALAIDGVIAELDQSSGKTLYGNLVFGTGITFPVNMSTAQLLALTGAPKADGDGASGTWGISISGSAASATSATSATSAGTATNMAGTAQWSIPYQSASATTSYLAAGAAGQILTSAGNAAPTWAYPSVQINSQSADYSFALTDGGGVVYHPAADTTARTWTIPENASVAFPVGTVITIDNDFGAGALTIAITTDTLVLVGAAGSTGSRTVAAGSQATLLKVSATRWRISGAT